MKCYIYTEINKTLKEHFHLTTEIPMFKQKNVSEDQYLLNFFSFSCSDLFSVL